MPVGRRGPDDAQVPCAHQGKLQGPRDGGGREGQRVDIRFEGLQLVLDTHPKLLLFVDDQKAQVLELHAFAHNGMRADQDVHLPAFHLFQGFRQGLARLESVDELHGDRELAQTSAEALVVLHGQDGRGHQHGHLLAVARRSEGRPDGDFRFAKTHIAADQSVHRNGLEHVLLDGLARGILVGRVFVHEAGLQCVLQVAVVGVGMARCGLPLGIQLQQVVGNLLDPALGFLLGLGPCGGPELVDLGLGPFLGAVL